MLIYELLHLIYLKIFDIYTWQYLLVDSSCLVFAKIKARNMNTFIKVLSFLGEV